MLSGRSNDLPTVLCGKVHQLMTNYTEAAMSTEKVQDIMADLGSSELSTPVI